jgi:hypothetical protein
MIFSENRYPPRIKCGAGFFGIMLWSSAAGGGFRDTLSALEVDRPCGAGLRQPPHLEVAERLDGTGYESSHQAASK